MVDRNPYNYLLWRQGSGHTVEIYDLMVDATCRRNGVGRKLVDKLLDHYLPAGTRLVFAITRTSNFIAQQFYEELRFRVVGILRNFYQDERSPEQVDAIMYGRDIKPVIKEEK